MYAMYMSILDCAMSFELYQSFDTRYERVEMYVIINFELSFIVNMLLRIWIKNTCDCVYATANRLADDAVRQNKVNIQNVREVLERDGGIIIPK